jgi:hypothetical protein
MFQLEDDDDLYDSILTDMSGYGDGRCQEGYGNGNGDGENPINYYTYDGNGGHGRSWHQYRTGDGFTREMSNWL